MVKPGEGGRGGKGSSSSPSKGAGGTAALRASWVLCFTPVGSAYSGPHSDAVLHLSLLPFELSGV